MNEINTKSFQVSKYYEIGYYQRDQNIFGSYPNDPDEMELEVELRSDGVKHRNNLSFTY